MGDEGRSIPHNYMGYYTLRDTGIYATTFFLRRMEPGILPSFLDRTPFSRGMLQRFHKTSKTVFSFLLPRWPLLF